MSRRYLLSFLIPLLLPGLLHAKLPRGGASDYEETHTTWVYPTKRHSILIRGTQTHLSALTFGKAKFINPQGISAVNLVQKEQEDTDPKDRLINMTVYGVNTGQNSIIYNRSMIALTTYGYDETGEARLNEPWDIVGLSDGQVFVTDTGNRRIVKLRNVDGYLRYDSSFGQDKAKLVEPRGIDATYGGWVFVADAGSGRVVMFDTTGNVLKDFKQFDRPHALAAIDIYDPCFQHFYTTAAAFFVVADSGGKRLTKCDFEGRVVARTSLPDELDGKSNPRVSHIEIDRYQNVIASDSANNRLLKFSKDLFFLTSWGQKGKKRGQFTGPTGVGIWRKRGRTFVADQLGAQYLWMGTDISEGPETRIDAAQKTLNLIMVLTENSRVWLDLVDSKGDTVLSRQTIREAGPVTVSARLENRTIDTSTMHLRSSRRPWPLLPPGEYTLSLRLKPLYSSWRYFTMHLETTIDLPELAPIFHE